MTTTGWLHRPAIQIVLLALLGVAAASGTTLNYNLNFTGGPTLPTSGSFSYDTTTDTFISFVATWDGLFFDFTSEANITGGNLDCSSNNGPAEVFDMLTGACSLNVPPYEWHAEFGDTPGGVVASFSFDNAISNPSAGLTVSETVLAANTSNSAGAYSSSTAASVPEPTSLILTIAGAALLFMRRRGLHSRLELHRPVLFSWHTRIGRTIRVTPRDDGDRACDSFGHRLRM